MIRQQLDLFLKTRTPHAKQLTGLCATGRQAHLGSGYGDKQREGDSEEFHLHDNKHIGIKPNSVETRRVGQEASVEREAVIQHRYSVGALL